jgi:cytochrome c-type biogenesis protein CcmF
MGWTFLAFMTVTLFGALALLLWRASSLRSREGLDSMVSRESAFLVNNVLLLAVAFVTLWGTIFPLISEVFQGQTVTVGAPFYNRVNGPLILGLIFMMGVGPLLPWRRATGRQLAAAFRYPVVAATLGALLLVAVGVRQPVALFALALFILVGTGILREWIRGTRARHRRGESYPLAFLNLLSSNRPRYGGYIVHLAIITLAVGVTGSSFYAIQQDYSLAPGETASLGPYAFRYLGVETTQFSDRLEETAQFEVSRGDSSLGVMTPKRTYYPEFDIGATRAAIRSTPLEDFYIVPSQFDEAGRGVFRVHIFPLVWWMWASGPILVLGTLVALTPQRRPAPVRARLPTGIRPAGVRTTQV